MTPKPRAKRRAQHERVKARTRRVMKLWAGRRQAAPDPRELGVNASTHCRRCGCWMCQAPHKDVAPRRERSFLQDDLSGA
jgi:hypothetical protein